MSQGHRNVGGAGMTQNQGNVLGDRPCIRQSKLFRQHDAGNAMKDLMGQGHLGWKTDVQEGAYAGMKVYDHNRDDPVGQKRAAQQQQRQAQPQQQQFQGYEQPQQQYQPVQQAPPMATQPVNTATAAPAKPVRQNYHNNSRDATFNFFTGESK